MAIRVDVSTAVVTGLDLVKKHHVDSMQPVSPVSSLTTATSSFEEDTPVPISLTRVNGSDETSSTIRDQGVRTSGSDPRELTCKTASPERNINSMRDSNYAKPSTDRSILRANGAVSQDTTEMAATPDSLVFRKGSFLDQLGINFLKPLARGRHTRMSLHKAMVQENRSPSRRGRLFDLFGLHDPAKPQVSSSRRDVKTSSDEGTLSGASSKEQMEEEQHQMVVEGENMNDEDDRPSSVLQAIVDDFRPGKGDQKILRAIGRTAVVNAVVLVTAATGGATAVAGFVTGGVITSKRIFDGLIAEDEREVTKALAVYGAATAGSVLGQAAATAIMVGLVGAGLPAAAAVAFAVGCVCGIAAGALSEWTVDGLIDTFGQVSDWTIESVLEALAGMWTRKLMRASREAQASTTPMSEVAVAPKIEFV